MWFQREVAQHRGAAVAVSALLASGFLLWYLFREAVDEEEMGQSFGANGYRTFIPTNEWQEVLPGYACPPGLEYRMDLWP
eukprot:symbB.v1.2.024349.t1/scaffold2293.1/size83143/2